MKRGFLLILIFWLCISVQGQITRSIWGLTLAESTAKDVREALIERGYSSKINESTNSTGHFISVDAYPIRFGGNDWSQVSFNIRNGRLHYVAFSYKSASSALATAKKLYNPLYNRYSSYLLAEYPWKTKNVIDLGTAYGPRKLIYSKDLAVCFRDGRTQIQLTHGSKTDVRGNRKEIEYEVSLIYSDSHLGAAGSESDL